MTMRTSINEARLRISARDDHDMQKQSVSINKKKKKMDFELILCCFNLVGNLEPMNYVLA